MKRLSLLLLSCGIVSGLQAQYVGHPITNDATVNTKKVLNECVNETFIPKKHTAAKTTAATFWTENFSTGSNSSLPTGWTTGAIAGPGGWKWMNVASHAMYGIGTISSTTASNGWMIFDSDSLGGATSSGPVTSAWLQSPSVSCSGHASVRLNFQSKYRRFQDSCFIWVSQTSTFAAGSYTVYPVTVNNTLAVNGSSANPTYAHVNITSAAASHSSVYIRFVFMGEPGGGYAWIVDDVNLSELDPHDISISRSFMWEPENPAYTGSIFSTPLAFVDSVYPITTLDNLGSSVESSVTLNAKIYNGGSSPVYSQSETYTGLAVGAEDTVMQFSTKYKPTSIGNYVCAFDASVSGDADMTNNVDSVMFNVTDTTWMVNSGPSVGGYYLHKKATTASPSTFSYLQGARFDVPTVATGDTVSGFGVSFSSNNVDMGTGSKVSVQLYSVDQAATGWTYMGTSTLRTLTTADYNSSTQTVWTYFPADPIATGGWGFFVLQAGKTYAAVIQDSNVVNDLVVSATARPNATRYSGYFGQSDSSNNNGGVNAFGNGSLLTGINGNVPMVRMYFGKAVTPPVNSIAEVGFTNKVGQAYPNPANTQVTVPFTVSQDAQVTVSLTDVVGQVVKTQVLNATAGNTSKVNFTTSDLASGIYLYSVTANGQQYTGRITVAH